MKERKLISMAEFVSLNEMINYSDYWFRVITLNYAKFLSQPLELGMFIPCVDGVPIEEPTQTEKNEFGGAFASIEEQAELYSLMEQYQQAKEKVLFEGFNVTLVKSRNQPHYYIVECTAFAWVTWNDSFTVEKLVRIKPTLTQLAIKQLGI